MFDLDKPIAVYNEFRSQLAEWRKLNDSLAFDYESAKGNKEARSHIYKLRQSKAAVDRVRKEAKAEALEYGRKVDAEAKDIVTEIEAMIETHDAPLREIEEREKARIAAHEARLDAITQDGDAAAANWLTADLADMRARAAEIAATPITEEAWEEYLTGAAKAKDKAAGQFQTAIAMREKHDAEQAELARLRKEEEERKAKEREAETARQAAERAKAEAEAKAKADAERAAREAQSQKEAAEKRELELKLQAERAEREKAEAERRASEAEERAKREAAEAQEAQRKKEADEQAKREANKAHKAKINRAAVAAMQKHAGLTEDQGKAVLKAIADGKVPAVKVSY